MADFRVQNFDVQLINDGESVDLASMRVTIPKKLRDATRARLIMSNQRGDAYLASSLTETQAAEWESRDFMMMAYILSPQQVILIWDAAASYPQRAAFSILEYIGPAGGANEFTVTRGFTTMLDGDSFIEVSLASMGVTASTAQKVTLNKTGTLFSSADTSGVHVKRTTVMSTVIFNPDIDTATVGQFRCGETSGPDMTIAWEAVNWIGSNWGVGRAEIGKALTLTGGYCRWNNLPATMMGTQPTDWDQAFVEFSHSIEAISSLSTGGGDGLMYARGRTQLDRITPYKGGTQTTGGGNTPDNSFCFYVISNPDIFVLAQGNYVLTGSAFPQDGMTTDGPTRFRESVDMETNLPSTGITAPSLCCAIGYGWAPVGVGTEVNPHLGAQDHGMQWVPERVGVREVRTRDSVFSLEFWWYIVQFGRNEVDPGVTQKRSVIGVPDWKLSIEAS